MNEPIEPRVLKGFRDFLPDRETRRLAIIRALEEAFRLFGFLPIDTPVLEYAEVLLGKGGGETDKQVYRFLDHGGRDVAMRYDLTVPFARFMAAHLAELPLPFRRYHAAKVWRGENTQRGRYREFVQVDFDVVGADSASADLEILLLMRECMERLGIAKFTIRYSHRGVFNAFLERQGLGGKSVEVLRTIDKERKVGREKTLQALEEIAGPEAAEALLRFVSTGKTAAETLAGMARAVGEDSDGVRRLSEISRCLGELDLAARFTIDPSITRGLDYYTGVVFETFLDDLPQIGSVCSGGRYNDLASLYTRQSLPGVGASVGLDRLMAAMEELGIAAGGASPPPVLILCLDDGLLPSYHRFAAAFRAAGIPAEVYPEKRKLTLQFSYAEKRGVRFVLIHGGEEAAQGTVTLKELASRESFEGLSLESAIGKARELLR
jgi:histidyl-tRNA synthetase